jgi:hypothetical protein
MPCSDATWLGKIFNSRPEPLYGCEPDRWDMLKSSPIKTPLAQAEDYSETMRAFDHQLPPLHQTQAKVACSTTFFPMRCHSRERFNLNSLRTEVAKSFVKSAIESPR